jgi:hypothetical protein
MKANPVLLGYPVGFKGNDDLGQGGGCGSSCPWKWPFFPPVETIGYKFGPLISQLLYCEDFLIIRIYDKESV